MIRRLFERVFGFLGIGYGWCGGCSDPDCMDCAIEWDRPIGYDGFGAPIYRHQVEDE